MNAVELVRRLHEHRQWANGRLLDAAGGLSDGALRESYPIGQGSIWRTLLHLMAAEYVWLEALEGNESPTLPGDVPGRLPGNQEGENRIASFDELRRQWAALDERWAAHLDELTEDALDETVFKTSTSSGAGRRHGTRRADVLIHVCTHAQYTTAQAVNMLRQAGVESLPDVMLISLARSESV